ncbi:hypothetical protein Tco_1028916 [Tanacetum coccineum]|uniref:DUF4219 domain-containing protein/UBN2 domain-containing protein n=1 Tax=Tanacetum coccineum TaxID=301880 RepID=A0ABQ5G3D3_9ASTR
MSEVLFSRHEVIGVTTKGGKMTYEVTYDKEINKANNDHNEPSRFQHNKKEKPQEAVVENESPKKGNLCKDHHFSKAIVLSIGKIDIRTYVKSKDLDLWHVITNGDFQPIIQNPETKLDEVVPFEKQTDDLKRRLAKNNEAKMVIYNALPRKEYEQIFMCNTAKEIWKTLLITHQGNSQVKDNKIDLLVQQYEQFVISEDESIDSAFARFNTIITSLKVLDEGYSSKNYAKKESSDEECSTSDSEDEEYAMEKPRRQKRQRKGGALVAEILIILIEIVQSTERQEPKSICWRFLGGDCGEEDDETIQDEDKS